MLDLASGHLFPFLLEQLSDLLVHRTWQTRGGNPWHTSAAACCSLLSVFSSPCFLIQLLPDPAVFQSACQSATHAEHGRTGHLSATAWTGPHCEAPERCLWNAVHVRVLWHNREAKRKKKAFIEDMKGSTLLVGLGFLFCWILKG